MTLAPASTASSTAAWISRHSSRLSAFRRSSRCSSRRGGSRTRGDTPPAPAGPVAETWQGRIRRAQRHGRKVSHYLELRYEDLVTDTEPNLRRIAEFLELPWDAAMLTYYENAAERMAEMARDLPATDGKPTRPGEERMQAHAMTQKPPDPSAMYRWKEKMSPEDVAAFDAAAGELLADLGYEVGTETAATGA